MKNCECEATCGIALRIPAMHCPIPKHEPIRLVIGLQLCDRHFKEADAQDFLNADARLRQCIRIMARGRTEPDFDRAFMERVEFDDPDWLKLTKK